MLRKFCRLKKAYRTYMQNEISVNDLSDDERSYIQSKLRWKIERNGRIREWIRWINAKYVEIVQSRLMDNRGGD